MHARWVTAVAAIGALAVPAGALAGGWATVGLRSTPDGLRPGQPWLVELEILQHGRTPLDGVKPTVIVTERGTDASRTVSAVPTGRTGVYRARVVFPRAGEWEYVIDDGFSQRHSYPPVRIGGAPMAAPAPSRTAGGDDGVPGAAFVAALAAGLAAAGLTLATQRRRRRDPARGTGGAAPVKG